jgi:hypothetical protein
MQLQRARVLACFAVSIALVLESRAGDSSMPTFVPWKVLNPGDETLKTDLVLFWIPSSRDEIRRSPLLTSRPLAIYSTQCVGMQIVRPDDDETIEKLGASGHLPMAVLAGADGAIIASLGGAAMRLPDVEKMVRDTIIAREAGADRLLDDAREKAESGDREAAIALYRRVCAQRCLLPRKARDAQKALHRLGEE